ncbi:hypothetical protein PRUPE_1G311200 [Prunus persica]|uniref:Uncharacterized protein n=1 Tax=Prunus persica TaxID=3760 RepID=A0A251R5T9_PRUPE|nr:hypothetical protein PRUPE_1G311200 [Prunus persica]
MGSLGKIKTRNWFNKNTSCLLFKKIGEEGPMKTHRLPNHQVQVVHVRTCMTHSIIKPNLIKHFSLIYNALQKLISLGLIRVVRNIFLPRKGKMSKKERVQISVLC